ncbi:MAG: hypothetical protein JW786_10125 [Desulfobacterales bacterium]|nr:hypothetical protein [Desulfobacterales bacterium]
MTIYKNLMIKQWKKWIGIALRGFIILDIFFLLVGCRGETLLQRFKQSTDPYKGSPYRLNLSDWTRQARIYRGFDLELIVDATFQSHQFRSAYVAEYIRAYKLIGREKEKLIQAQKDAADRYHDFFIAAYVPEKKLNDFSACDSIWKLYLSMDGKERIQPIEIRKIKKIDAIIRHFYPFMTPWKSMYLVRFPAEVPGINTKVIGKETVSFKLIITSVLGNVEMVWDG